jgi:hypothetical protein
MRVRWALWLLPVMGVGLMGADAGPDRRPTPEAVAIPPLELTWSSRFMDKTPAGDVAFHGPFGKETLTVSADHLPKHAVLDVRVRLLILRTWDGSPDWPITHKDQPGGPDCFRMALAGGPTLLYTTFSNTPADPNFQPESVVQAFPSQVPGEHLPLQSGAAAKNSLGYNAPWPGKPALFPMDATYDLHFRIPHTADTVALDMQGINLQNLIDESWGVVDVQLLALPESAFPQPTAEQIEKAFQASLDPVTADLPSAFQVLIDGRADTVKWIAENVKPQPLDEKAIREALADLGAGDEKIAEREAADQTLIQMGHAVEPLLREVRETAGGELRLRIDWVLITLEAKPITTDELRRVMVATRVLEIIGTPEAMALRKKLTLQ